MNPPTLRTFNYDRDTLINGHNATYSGILHTAASASSGAAVTPAPLLRLPLALAGAGGEVAIKVQAMKPEEFAAAQERATKGDPDAQTMVCIAYRLGRFVPQGDGQGLGWCEKAANHNNLLAEADVGLQYVYGLGVSRDAARGLEWLKKAASQGSISPAARKSGKYEAASPVTSSPAVAKGKVVVATVDGQVVCFGSRQTPTPNANS